VKRSFFTKFFVVLTLAACFIGSSALAANKQLSLGEAEALANKELFHNELKEVILHEITPDEVWDKVGVQVYQEGFLIDNGNIVAIFDPLTPGVKMFTSDLDKDGSFELICSFLSGRLSPRNIISVYTKGKVLKMGDTLSDYLLSKSFILDKLDDQRFRLSNSVIEGGKVKDEIHFLYLRKEDTNTVVDLVAPDK
jgi:hypothetical protein